MLRWSTRSKLQFLIGLWSGIFISVVLFQFNFLYRHHMTILRVPATNVQVIGVSRGQHVHQMMPMDDIHVHRDDTRVADELAKKVRVLCWVMTGPANFRTKADAVKHTWGPRCNILLFFSSQYDEHLQTIPLNVSEGRMHLTAKTMLAFQYVYENYYDQADWFMKCDDDTYVIVENLRYFLSTKNTNEPVYFGHHFRPLVKQGYFSGGAGYILGKEALTRFAKRNSTLCRDDGGSEDVEMGRCMEKLGIKAGNSTDSLGRTRFHCFGPEAHLNGDFYKWYYKYAFNGAKKGLENMSDYAVSFHYVQPNKQFALEFLVYHLRPYGIVSGAQAIN